MITYAIACLWGFSEATFFFLIPDIYLTYLAISKPTKAIKACFITAIGASLGGSLMYVWGNIDAHQALQLLTWIPAIYPKLIQMVIETTKSNPLMALGIAPFKGIPYKIYAVILGQIKISFFQFIVISFFARLFRFLLITTLGIGITLYLKKHYPVKRIQLFHIFTWVSIYGLYFLLMKQSYS